MNQPAIEQPKTGIFNMSAKDYHATHALSNSMMKELRKSPKALKYYIENPPEPSTAMQLGTLTHTLVLEPQNFTREFAVFTGKVRRGKAYDEFLEQNKGKIIITRQEFEEAQGIANSVRSHPIVVGALKGAVAERSVFWNDPVTGVYCKARPDLVRGNVMFDLKTTACDDLEDFKREIARLSYYVQASHYMQGYYHATGEKVDKFAIIAASKKAPYDCAVFLLDDEYIEIGRKRVREAIDLYHACETANEWPGYSNVVTLCESPSWLD